MEGPIVNGAYNSALRAIALSNHSCVSWVGKDTISVYRNKMFTISSNIKTTTESIRVSYHPTKFLLELKGSITFHPKKASETGSLLQEQVDSHIHAIDLIDSVINSRAESKLDLDIFLLKRIIEEKEAELRMLKNQLEILMNCKKEK